MKEKIIPFGLLTIFYALGMVILLSACSVSNAKVVSSKPSSATISVAKEGVKTAKQVKVPILMYHYIRVVTDPKDKLGIDLSVPPEEFSKQIALLSKEGFNTITLDDLVAAWNGKGTLPTKPIILTFDDGYEDFYTNALPILQEHSAKATAYIVPSFLNKPAYLTTSQVKELSSNPLITIAAHTMNHLDLRKISAKQLAYEVNNSKTFLEKLIGKPVVHFAYPSGRFNNDVIRAVSAAKYQTATTTQNGLWHSAYNRFITARVRVHGGVSLKGFEKLINQ